MKLQNIKNKHNLKDNVNTEERLAILSLQKNNDIVTKPADKGGAVVILDKSSYMYVQEGPRQLNDTHFYREIPKDQPAKITQEIDTFWKYLKFSSYP